MKIHEVKSRSPELIAILLDIWENSVRATHNFLTDAEIKRIREYVPQAINSVEHLAVAEDEYGMPAGFMGIWALRYTKEPIATRREIPIRFCI